MSAAAPTTSSGTANAAVRVRALTVLGATVAAIVVWGVSQAAGTDLLYTAAEGDPASEVTFAWVAGFALVTTLLGWGVLVLLERFTGSPAKIWLIVASAVLVLSFAGPFTADADTAVKVWLALMHLTVGAVLIPGLHRTVKPAS